MKSMIGDIIERTFITKAIEKARIKDIKINGRKATAVFSEYIAPDELKAEFEKYNGTDSHMYFITFYIWNGARSYYTGKEISTDRSYLTSKAEGNEIYRKLKSTNELEIDMSEWH